MQIILKRAWTILNTSRILQNSIASIPAGTYEVNRISDPYLPARRGPWLVIKDTGIGMPEHWWRLWQNTPGQDWHEYEIIIRQDDAPRH
jgi:hypothetical protein